MDASRFDAVARLFAAPHAEGARYPRRAQRAPGRHALAQAAAGLAAGAIASAGRTAAHAQDQDVAPPDAEAGPTMLFLQAFQAGGIAPKDGADERYVLTLEHGLGHTIYFSDRPHREVGAAPTPEFLAGLGFPEDNPPNAALVVEGAAGETEIAVLALYAPAYDEASRTATYEAEVLQTWQRSVQEGFVEATTDLAQRLPSFGAAHLFIDGCNDLDMPCYNAGGLWVGTIRNGEHGGYCYNWSSTPHVCLPCTPWYSAVADAEAYWNQQCNARFAECNGTCHAVGVSFGGSP
jgi:hypothetical protein